MDLRHECDPDRLFEKRCEILALSSASISAEVISKRFRTLEEELNAAKDPLRSTNPIEWSEHYKFVNRGALVLPAVKARLKSVEVHIPQVTIGFLKLYDILYVDGRTLIRNDARSAFFSAHLCEPPGAFVSATEQHLLERFGTSAMWKWMATGYNPHYEGNRSEDTTSDDSFVIRTPQRWYFGASGGDIFFTDFSRFEGHVDFVTADGNVDNSNDNENREVLHMRLIAREIQVAIKLLKLHGSLVIKMFGFLRPASRQLLYVLYKLFAKVVVRKTSVHYVATDEVHVVCCGFRGSAEVTSDLGATLEMLVSHGAEADSPSMPLDIGFEQGVLNCCEKFFLWQKGGLVQNFLWFQGISVKDKDRLEKCKDLVAEIYSTRIPILPREVEETRQLSFLTGRRRSLSSSKAWNVVSTVERQIPRWWTRAIPQLQSRLKFLYPEVLNPPATVFELANDSREKPVLKLRKEKFPRELYISRFIPQAILDLHNLLATPTERMLLKNFRLTRSHGIYKVRLDLDLTTNEDRRSALKIIQEMMQGIEDSEKVSIVVRLSESLSRFTAGMLLLLSMVGSTMVFQDKLDDLLTLEFRGVAKAELCSYVYKVCYSVNEQLASCEEGLTVTEIFPMRTLINSPLCDALTHCNLHFYAKHRIIPALEELSREQ